MTKSNYYRHFDLTPIDADFNDRVSMITPFTAWCLWRIVFDIYESINLAVRLKLKNAVVYAKILCGFW